MFSQKYKKTEKTLESSNESKSVLWLWLLWGRGGGDFKTGGREMFTHVPLYVVSTLSVWLLYQSCLCVCLGPAHFWLLLSMANIHRKLKLWRKLERLTGKMGLPKKKNLLHLFWKAKNCVLRYWNGVPANSSCVCYNRNEIFKICIFTSRLGALWYTNCCWLEHKDSEEYFDIFGDKLVRFLAER